MAIYYVCDKCGTRLEANDSNRFIVKIEAYAAAGPIELYEKGVDGAAEMAKLLDELKSADPDELEDQVYRSFRFDLCPACHREYLKEPLSALTALLESLDRASMMGHTTPAGRMVTTWH